MAINQDIKTADKPNISGPFGGAGAQPLSIPYGENVFVGTGEGKGFWLNVRGEPKGEPVFFVHGGPGAGPSAADEQLPDYERYCVFNITQRGCRQYGFLENPVRDPDFEQQSTKTKLQSLNKLLPEIQAVTFEDLINDFKYAYDYAVQNVWGGHSKKVSVIGSSWGGPLAMFIAARFPEKIKQVSLRGTSLVELCGRMNPQDFEVTSKEYENNRYFKRFVKILRNRRFFGENFLLSDVMNRLHAVMFDQDGKGGIKEWPPEKKLIAAEAWRAWNISLQYSYDSDRDKIKAAIKKFVFDDRAHAFLYGAIFSHSLVAQYPRYAPEAEYSVFDALEEMRSKNIPLFVVHGKGDDICPLDNALRLARATGEECSMGDLLNFNDDGDVVGTRAWRSRDGSVIVLPAMAGHAMAGDIMPQVMKAVLEMFDGNFSPLHQLFPELDEHARNDFGGVRRPEFRNG